MTATKYFKNAFAIAGDVANVPDDTQPSGTVSYEQGFPVGYELVQTDPASLDIPRNQTNQLYLDITSNIQQYQQVGAPNFITTVQNAGVPYPYEKYATVTYDDGVNGARRFMSKKNTNTSLPTVKADWLFIDNTSGATVLDNVTFDGAVAQGNAVYYDSASSTFKQALANGAGPQKIVGFADVTFSRVFMGGIVSFLTGLTAGQAYYLSSVTPGAITAVQPAVNIVQVGFSQSTTQLLVNIQEQASSFTSSIISNGYQINNQNGLIQQWFKSNINVVVGTNISTTTATFPIPFLNNVFSVVGSNNNPAGVSRGLNVSIYSESLTGFTFDLSCTPASPFGATQSIPIAFIAYGN